MDSLIVKWVPNIEKGLAVSIYTTGVQLSGALGIPFTAILCATVWKWPAVYYITGKGLDYISPLNSDFPACLALYYSTKHNPILKYHS